MRLDTRIYKYIFLLICMHDMYVYMFVHIIRDQTYSKKTRNTATGVQII